MLDSDISVYAIPGPRVVEEATLDRIRSDLQALVKRTPGIKLALDFSAVTFISSQALGVLVALRKDVKEAAGLMALFGIDGAVSKVVETTRLRSLFPICGSREEAAVVLAQKPKLPFWSGTDVGE